MLILLAVMGARAQGTTLGGKRGFEHIKALKFCNVSVYTGTQAAGGMMHPASLRALHAPPCRRTAVLTHHMLARRSRTASFAQTSGLDARRHGGAGPQGAYHPLEHGRRGAAAAFAPVGQVW